MRRFPWAVLLALLAGLGVGLLISWGIAPVRFVDTTPNTLRADFKTQMRSAIAAAYAADDNLPRARARLSLLGDTDSYQALSAQAQQMLAAGETSARIHQVAQLAADLQQPPPETAAIVSSSPTFTSSAPPPTRPNIPTTIVTLTETILPDQVITPPATISTATPRPTHTPTSAPGKPFELVAQEPLCQTDLQDGLMQVILTDSHRRQLAGVEIIVSWDGGEDHFFSGLKPEIGNGYADFVMQPGILYNVRVADGAPVPNVSAPACTAADGTTFTGAIRLSFQQP